MLENNFVYVSAVLSIFAIAYVVAKVILILHMKDNYKGSYKYHVATMITGLVYELITIVTAIAIINNVILNIYCYLLFADAIFVLFAYVIYYLHYLMFKRRDEAEKVEDSQEVQTEAQPVQVDNTKAIVE